MPYGNWQEKDFASPSASQHEVSVALTGSTQASSTFAFAVSSARHGKSDLSRSNVRLSASQAPSSFTGGQSSEKKVCGCRFDTPLALELQAKDRVIKWMAQAVSTWAPQNPQDKKNSSAYLSYETPKLSFLDCLDPTPDSTSCLDSTSHPAVAHQAHENQLLSLYRATEELSDTNVPTNMLKNIRERLQKAQNGTSIDAPRIEFSKHFLKVTDVHGKMHDNLVDIWVTMQEFWKQMDPTKDAVGLRKDSATLLEDDKAAEQRREQIRMERHLALVKTLQRVLEMLNDLRWDEFKGEFSRFVKMVRENDVVFNEMADHIVETTQEILTVLNMSRFAVEESFGSHMLLASQALAKFYDRMRRKIEANEKVEEDESVPSARKLRLHHMSNVLHDVKLRTLQTLRTAMSLKTTVADAMKADEAVAGKNQKTEKKVSGIGGSLSEGKRGSAAYVDSIFMRCNQRGRSSFDEILRATRERNELMQDVRQRIRFERLLRQQADQPTPHVKV